jgi:hypothetical protein
MTCFTKTNPTMSLQRQLLLLMLVFLFALSTEAFQAAITAVPTKATTNTALQAWSLPNDGSFGLKSTWYNEYNPTARATVYHE